MLKNKDIQYMKACISFSKIFSTCSKKQYAAIVLDKNNYIVGMGYNGGPSGILHCKDGGCPRTAEDSLNGSTYDNCIAIHAEQNALLHCDYSSSPEKMYVNGPPCFTCAKLIANSTINNIYYIPDSNYSQWEKIRDFLLQCGVQTYMIEPWQLEN